MLMTETFEILKAIGALALIVGTILVLIWFGFQRPSRCEFRDANGACTEWLPRTER